MLRQASTAPTKSDSLGPSMRDWLPVRNQVGLAACRKLIWGALTLLRDEIRGFD